MKHRIQLDWSRLLGFDQVAGRRLDETRLAKSGSKPEVTPNTRLIGAKAGSKPQAVEAPGRIGAKAGLKPADRRAIGRIGARAGSKPLPGPVALGHRLGAKVGSKPIS